MHESTGGIPIHFVADMTLRWSCRAGDLIFWFRWSDVFSGRPRLTALDTWSLKNGDSVTLTNRWFDIPPWLKLCPSEVCDSFAYRLMEQYKSGQSPPLEITGGLNIWRVRAGDSIVWTGMKRPGQAATDDVLSVVTFEECALAVGEGTWRSMDEMLAFGVSQQNSPTTTERKYAQTALKLVHTMGLPRMVSTEWLLG